MLAYESLVGGIAGSLIGSEPIPVDGIARHTEVECISQEAESPDEFKDVQNFPYARVVEVEEVVVSGEYGREAAVLPDDESD